MEISMPQWALELLKSNELSDLDIQKIVTKVKMNDQAFSVESKETSTTSEDKLRRYNM
jgi:hypothetical protein